MKGYRCPLARLMPQSVDSERIKREGWIEQKILVVALDDHRLSKFDRELVKNLGDSLYKNERGNRG